MQIKRTSIVNFLNKYLNVEKIKDVSANGLQVEGRQNVQSIVFGVSASGRLFEQAVKNKADMVIVHHGIIWDKSFRIKGYVKRRIKLLLDNDINLLAFHLPLDKHAQCGNNITLLKYFNVKNVKPFGIYDGNTIGYKADLTKALTLKRIAGVFRKKLKSNAKCAAFGPEKIKNLAVISGGAPEIINQAIEENLDLFVTGETREYAWELCRENGLNYMALGHYNSEKAGILALQKVVREKFKVKTRFIDVPNPF
jgi:dinuclear metal center YbgI/SA1388 family protein